ncbi:MAG: aminopeptidase, partial [Verrucomicrobiota bacterium]
EFSESLAVAVEQEGVRRWFGEKGDDEALQKYERSLTKTNAFVDRVLADRDALEKLYASDLSETEKRTRKRDRLHQLQEHVRSLLRAAGREEEDTFWLRDELNNAHLNIVAAYHEGVPKFERLLAECGGDLSVFYEKLEDFEL